MCMGQQSMFFKKKKKMDFARANSEKNEAGPLADLTPSQRPRYDCE